MNGPLILKQIEVLSPDEKFDLVFQIWNRLAADSQRWPALTESRTDVIDRRIQSLDANPQATLTWDEILGNVRRER